MQNIFRVFCLPGMQRRVSTLWLLMWQLHSGFQFSGHVVLERKQEDGTQLIWLPMMYITRTLTDSAAKQPSGGKERMLEVCKQGLDWRGGGRFVRLSWRAVSHEGVRSKGRHTTRHCVLNWSLYTTPEDELCDTFLAFFLCDWHLSWFIFENGLHCHAHLELAVLIN